MGGMRGKGCRCGAEASLHLKQVFMKRASTKGRPRGCAHKVGPIAHRAPEHGHWRLAQVTIEIPRGSMQLWLPLALYSPSRLPKGRRNMRLDTTISRPEIGRKKKTALVGRLVDCLSIHTNFSSPTARNWSLANCPVTYCLRTRAHRNTLPFCVRAQPPYS